MGTSANRHPRRLAPAFRQPAVTVYTADGTVQMIAQADYNRVVLMIQVNAAGTFDLTINATAAGGTGVTVTQAAGPFVLSYNEHGRLVQEAWYLNAGMIGTPVTVIELALQDEDYIGRL